MRDLFEKIYRDKGPLGKWASHAEGYFVFPKLEGQISNRMKFQGKDVITWSINDYLGLANHPEIRNVDAEAGIEYGSAYPMGARMMSGHTTLHEQLQDELAEFVSKEASYLLNFGYQGMVSTIDALVTKNDIIVYDVDAHACIIDGVRLHIGKRFTYRHNDIESLEKNLERATKMAEHTGGGILVITEGVFGMRGEQGKIKEIVALKKDYNFRLLVDDAHGFGVLEANIPKNSIYMATLGKAAGTMGAFVAGNDDFIDYLVQKSRPYVYTTAISPSLCCATLKSLELIKSGEQKIKLLSNIDFFQNFSSSIGLNFEKSDSAIQPMIIGDSKRTLDLSKKLFDTGFYVSAIRPPTVSTNTARLRFTLCANHSFEQIEALLTQVNHVMA